jgi:hypothetical protein
MANNTLLKLYSQSNYMVVNRDLAKKIGLTNSIVFGQLCSLQDSLGSDFFHTQDRLAESCCISVSTLKRSISELVKNGYLTTTRRGTPCKSYYTVQWSNWLAQNELTSESKMNQLDSPKRSNIISNKESSNKMINNNTKSKNFVKPTIDEIQVYCKARRNNVDAQKFLDYYESKGWVVGKNSKMKSWKAAIRTWEGNSYNNSSNSRTGNTRLSQETYQDYLKDDPNAQF